MGSTPDVTTGPRCGAIEPDHILASLDALLARSALGLRLLSGWKVALAGRPNVGKSRLLNALSGFERAIVAPTPGTTRDVLTVRTALDGWPVELCDTAGLRPTADAIEATGVALARELHEEVDLILLVLDRSEPLTDTDRQLMEMHASALWVANKADLPAAWDDPVGDCTVVSAERGDGMDLLAGRIAQQLVPEFPPPGAAVPFRVAHVEALMEARQALQARDLGRALQRLDALTFPVSRG